MAPRDREPTNQQISSRLSYSQNTPSFLLKLQNRIAGIPDDEEEEYEYDGSGRPPIPRRPAIPERPDNDPGSDDEDDGDDKPQVVVLKAGKHLTAREAENEKRKGACFRLNLLSLHESKFVLNVYQKKDLLPFLILQKNSQRRHRPRVLRLMHHRLRRKHIPRVSRSRLLNLDSRKRQLA